MRSLLSWGLGRLPHSRHLPLTPLPAHLCYSDSGRSGDTEDCSSSQPSSSQVRAEGGWGLRVGRHALLATPRLAFSFGQREGAGRDAGLS